MSFLSVVARDFGNDFPDQIEKNTSKQEVTENQTGKTDAQIDPLEKEYQLLLEEYNNTLIYQSSEDPLKSSLFTSAYLKLESFTKLHPEFFSKKADREIQQDPQLKDCVIQ